MSTEVTPQIAAALDAAAIPRFKVGPGHHARLTDSERDLYFWILRQFAETDVRPARRRKRQPRVLGSTRTAPSQRSRRKTSSTPAR